MLGGTVGIPVRENLRKAFQIGLLSGSLIWSANCSSAPVTSAAEPSSAPVTAAGGPKCNQVEAPTLIHRVEPDYPKDVRKRRLEGKVLVEAILTVDGTLVDFKVVSSPSKTLTRLAIEAFRQRRYKPAFCKDWGKPIRVYVTITTTFKLHPARRGSDE
jgi:protein TonB